MFFDFPLFLKEKLKIDDENLFSRIRNVTDDFEMVPSEIWKPANDQIRLLLLEITNLLAKILWG